MSSATDDKILGLPRRPRMGDSGSGAILGGIAGALFSGNLAGALAGGLAGGVIASQPQPLETAVREHLASKGVQMIFFQRAPRAIKVTFRDGADSYWTISSVMPDELILQPQDVEDWLYGNFVKKELPKLARKVKALTAK